MPCHILGGCQISITAVTGDPESKGGCIGLEKSTSNN